MVNRKRITGLEFEVLLLIKKETGASGTRGATVEPYGMHGFVYGIDSI